MDRKTIEALFATHAPARLTVGLGVGGLLAQWRGRHEALFETLTHEYGAPAVADAAVAAAEASFSAAAALLRQPVLVAPRPMGPPPTTVLLWSAAPPLPPPAAALAVLSLPPMPLPSPSVGPWGQPLYHHLPPPSKVEAAKLKALEAQVAALLKRQVK
jgi:hypothetical protein